MTKLGSTDRILRPGSADGEGKHLDQLVGPVSQQQAHLRRNAHRLAQCGLDDRTLRVRIAIQGDVAQDIKPFSLQALRPAIGVLHRIELHQTGGIRDMVGRQGMDVGANEPGDLVMHVRL
jgi:hypothetical protein